MNKKVAVLLILTLILSMFSGCSNTPQDAKGTQDTQDVQEPFVIVSSGVTESLDPTNIMKVGAEYRFAVFDTLVRVGEDGEIIPHIAKSWVEEEDGLTITLTLRDDVYFHDGSQLTAEDVEYTFDLLYADEINSIWTERFYTSIEMVDKFTVKVTKANYLTDSVSNLTADPIISKAAREENIEVYGETNPIGSGPYKFISQENDGTIKLFANEEYFLGVPEINEIIIRPSLSPETAVIALEIGEVDVIPFVPAIQYDMVNANENIKVIDGTVVGETKLVFIGATLQGDINLKKAIAHVMDKEKALILGSNGRGKLAEDLFDASIMEELKGEVKLLEYNLDLAKDYLSKSDYDTKKPLTLTTLSSDAAIATSLQADFASIGLTLEIEVLDSGTFEQKVFTEVIDLAIYTFSGGGGFFLQDALESLQIVQGNMLLPDSYYEIIQSNYIEKDVAKRNENKIKALEILLYDLATIQSLYTNFANKAYRSDKIEDMTLMYTDYSYLYIDKIKLK